MTSHLHLLWFQRLFFSHRFLNSSFNQIFFIIIILIMIIFFLPEPSFFENFASNVALWYELYHLKGHLFLLFLSLCLQFLLLNYHFLLIMIPIIAISCIIHEFPLNFIRFRFFLSQFHLFFNLCHYSSLSLSFYPRVFILVFEPHQYSPLLYSFYLPFIISFLFVFMFFPLSVLIPILINLLIIFLLPLTFFHF